MASSQVNTHHLTRHPSASLRELFSLSLPLIFVLFSGSLMGFCDRLFLAHDSLEALEGCVNAVYLCTLFQMPCIRITSMAQIFAGFHKGANQPSLIGGCIWQMIWFSLLSMFLTLPISTFVGPFFLGGTSIEEPAMTYFRCMMAVNFLFPMGASLASFFIAQGKTKILFIATVCAHAINILLDYILIFGINNVLPPLGIFGAALATAIAQGIFCIILLLIFLQKQNRITFGTNQYLLKWKIFWNYVQVGVPRAIARIVLLAAWAATARIITLKGGDYLIVLSVGGSLFLLFSFINEGMSQAMMTIASHLIGTKEYSSIQKLIRTAFFFLSITMIVLTIPFLIYPNILLKFFFSSSLPQETVDLLYQSCGWLWLLLLCNGINMIGFSLISAACDTMFHMIANSFVWLTTYLPVYLAFNVGMCSADKFWLIIALDALIFGLIYLWRAHLNNTRQSSYEKCHNNLL